MTTIKELIAKLQQFDENTDISIDYNFGEIYISYDDTINCLVMYA